MNKGTVLKIKPQAVGESLHQNAHAKLPQRLASIRRRKGRTLLLSPLSDALFPVTITEMGKSEWDLNCSYHMQARAADHLMSINALTENVTVASAKSMATLFTQSLVCMFPEVPQAQLSIADCSMPEIEAEYYFRFPTATETFKAWSQLQFHSQIVLDGIETHFERKKKAVNTTPRVSTSEATRWTFTVQIPFGTVTFRLVRFFEDCPRSFANTPDREGRVKLRSLMQCILIATASVDLAKFSFFEKTLPLSPELWTKETLSEDPYKTIWDAIRYQLWLNWPLLRDASEAQREDLDEEEGMVLDAYFEPDKLDIRDCAAMRLPDGPAKIRTRLINASFVDIDIPWSFLAQNMSEELGAALEYENRFKPSEHELLAPHTLSRETVDAAVAKLDETLAIKPVRLKPDA